MSITSHRTGRVLAGLAATAAATTGLVVAGAPAQAVPTTSTVLTITKVAPLRVAALTANQVITITGTGFSEDNVKSITVANTCAGTYVVTSPTTIAFKTDATCTAATTHAITITDSAGNDNTAVTTAAQTPVFVAAPTIATPSGTVKPVLTDNTSGVAYANQVTTAPITGGTTIKVVAGTTPFVNSTTYPLKATLGGVALTNIKMATGGTSFTGVVGAVTAANAAPALVVTSDGVSKSFGYAAGTTAGTHQFQYAGTGITVSPASGPVNGTNVIKIAGSGFTTATTATVGGVSCPKAAAPVSTATAFYCTVAAVTAAGPVTVATATSGLTSVVGAGSTYTFLDQ